MKNNFALKWWKLTAVTDWQRLKLANWCDGGGGDGGAPGISAASEGIRVQQSLAGVVLWQGVVSSGIWTATEGVSVELSLTTVVRLRIPRRNNHTFNNLLITKYINKFVSAFLPSSW